MFALTCPHCQAEVKTRMARPGAMVKCMACQKTYVLGAANIRELPTTAPLPQTEAAGDAEHLPNLADTQTTMAVIHAMAEDLPQPEPKVDIYAGQPAISPGAVHTLTKLALALALLIAVVVGAAWLFTTTPALQKLFQSTPSAHPSREPGTKPATEF